MYDGWIKQKVNEQHCSFRKDWGFAGHFSSRAFANCLQGDKALTLYKQLTKALELIRPANLHLFQSRSIAHLLPAWYNLLYLLVNMLSMPSESHEPAVMQLCNCLKWSSITLSHPACFVFPSPYSISPSLQPSFSVPFLCVCVCACAHMHIVFLRMIWKRTSKETSIRSSCGPYNISHLAVHIQSYWSKETHSGGKWTTGLMLTGSSVKRLVYYECHWIIHNTYISNIHWQINSTIIQNS